MGHKIKLDGVNTFFLMMVGSGFVSCIGYFILRQNWVTIFATLYLWIFILVAFIMGQSKGKRK